MKKLILRTLIPLFGISLFLASSVSVAVAQCGLPGTPPCKTSQRKTTKVIPKKRISKAKATTETVKTSKPSPQILIPVTTPTQRWCLSPDIMSFGATCPEDVVPKYLPADKDQGYDIAIVNVDKALLRELPKIPYSPAEICTRICLVGDEACANKKLPCEAPKLYKRDFLVILDRVPVNDWLNVINIETAQEGWVWKGHIDIYYTRSPKSSTGAFEQTRTDSYKNPEVKITNDTNRTLMLRLGNQVYTIESYSSRVLYLSEGSYKFYAALPKAYPLIGEKYFSKGYGYSWTFYIE